MFLTIRTDSYNAGSIKLPFAVILTGIFGSYAGIGTAILAVFIIFGLINAYISFMSRVLLTSVIDWTYPLFLSTGTVRHRCLTREAVHVSHYSSSFHSVLHPGCESGNSFPHQTRSCHNGVHNLFCLRHQNIQGMMAERICCGCQVFHMQYLW